MKKIVIGPKPITIEDVWEVAQNRLPVFLSEGTKKRVARSRMVVENIVKKGEIAYGINTGFGKLKDKIIPRDKVRELQANLIHSHAVGVGEPYGETEARAIMFARLVSLAQGHSGIGLKTLEKIIELLNKNIIPYIPSQGSVGASGDLAPLSHLALVLIGEGKALLDGQWAPTAQVFKRLGIKPVELTEKEGLALNNGTAVMTAVAALNLKKAEDLTATADIAGAMSLEVMMGTLTAFDEKIQAVRPHPGQKTVARNIRHLCRGSEIILSHADCGRVQDAYSLRCIPQVHGAARDAIDHCRRVTEIEINSATDNPLVFADEKTVKSGGNFHGEPIAIVMDLLAIAVSELGNISERRTFKMLTKETSEGLPPFLCDDSEVGLHSGLMMVQYTAASLVAENKVYSHPASVDSIPTCANQEDHVSFGTIAANKCRNVLENLAYILAIELLCGTQAAGFKKPLKLGKGTAAACAVIREKAGEIEKYRELHEDINTIKKLIENGAIIERLRAEGIKIA